MRRKAGARAAGTRSCRTGAWDSAWATEPITRMRSRSRKARRGRKSMRDALRRALGNIGESLRKTRDSLRKTLRNSLGNSLGMTLGNPRGDTPRDTLRLRSTWVLRGLQLLVLVLARSLASCLIQEARGLARCRAVQASRGQSTALQQWRRQIGGSHEKAQALALCRWCFGRAGIVAEERGEARAFGVARLVESLFLGLGKGEKAVYLVDTGTDVGLLLDALLALVLLVHALFPTLKVLDRQAHVQLHVGRHVPRVPFGNALVRRLAKKMRDFICQHAVQLAILDEALRLPFPHGRAGAAVRRVAAVLAAACAAIAGAAVAAELLLRVLLA